MRHPASRPAVQATLSRSGEETPSPGLLRRPPSPAVGRGEVVGGERR